MHRYVELAHSMLKNNFTGLLAQSGDRYGSGNVGIARTHEMHIPLQWLYEKYPRNNSAIIWETMELMISGGVLWGADWRTFWVDGVYPTGQPSHSINGIFTHGVNEAEGKLQKITIQQDGTQFDKANV